MEKILSFRKILTFGDILTYGKILTFVLSSSMKESLLVERFSMEKILTFLLLLLLLLLSLLLSGSKDVRVTKDRQILD